MLHEKAGFVGCFDDAVLAAACRVDKAYFNFQVVQFGPKQNGTTTQL